MLHLSCEVQGYNKGEFDKFDGLVKSYVMPRYGTVTENNFSSYLKVRQSRKA